jgi:hypothetical protein
MGSPRLLHLVYAADFAATPGHSPPLIGETNLAMVLRTLADEQASASANKKEQITIECSFRRLLPPRGLPHSCSPPLPLS